MASQLRRASTLTLGALSVSLGGFAFGLGVAEPEASAGSEPPARHVIGRLRSATGFVPAAQAVPSIEVGAVVEVGLPGQMAANTPMHEQDAALELARAWQAVQRSPPSEQTLAVLWAHWAHETARGKRMHAHNFAGIKGRGPSGASVVVWTREGASNDLVQRTFRAYRNPAEGARDYVRLLATRYPSALRAARDGNAYGFASALDSGGYFTGDGRIYLRALSSLSLECRRRGVAAAALRTR